MVELSEKTDDITRVVVPQVEVSKHHHQFYSIPFATIY